MTAFCTISRSKVACDNRDTEFTGHRTEILAESSDDGFYIPSDSGSGFYRTVYGICDEIDCCEYKYTSRKRPKDTVRKEKKEEKDTVTETGIYTPTDMPIKEAVFIFIAGMLLGMLLSFLARTM